MGSVPPLKAMKFDHHSKPICHLPRAGGVSRWGQVANKSQVVDLEWVESFRIRHGSGTGWKALFLRVSGAFSSGGRLGRRGLIFGASTGSVNKSELLAEAFA
jgi:hypothetical protein